MQKSYTLFNTIKIHPWFILTIIAALSCIISFYFLLKKAKNKDEYENAFWHMNFWGIAGMYLYPIFFMKGDLMSKLLTHHRESFGFILGFIIACIYLKIKKISIKKFLDLTLIPFLILATIVRFANGLVFSETGKITTLPWGVFFSNAIRHPIGLYYFIANFIILLFMLILKNKTKITNKDGLLFYSGLLLFSLKRVILDFLRVQYNYILPNFSINQFAFLLLTFFALYNIILLTSNSQRHK